MKKSITISFILLLSFSVNTRAQGWIWGKLAGGLGDAVAYSVTTDPSGNVYQTGYFYSATITFGTTVLTNAGSADMFLVKYSPSGSVLWAMSAGGTLYDVNFSVVTDASGNVYVAGSFESPSITFGATTLTNSGGGGDIFVVKFDSTGTVIWARNTGVASNVMDVKSVAVDAVGNVYATGSFGSATLVYGSTVLTNAGSYPSNDMYLVKYDASGNFKWVVRAGGTGDELANCITTDASCNIYVAGYSQSPTITFGTSTLTNTGSDMFIAKYDSLGNAAWGKNSGSASALAQSVSVDASSGDLYVSGLYSTDSITFGSSTFINAGPGSYDIFLVKYTNAGSVVWARGAGGSNGESAAGVHADASGNVYVTGYFTSSTLTLGTTILTAGGGYVVKYNAAGTVQYALSADSGAAYGISVTTDDSDNVYMAGAVNGAYAAFGPVMLTNPHPGSEAALVVKYHQLCPLPNAGIITGMDSVCPGLNIILVDTVSGGVWSSSNANATIAGGVVTGVSPGADTIRYIYTNSCGSDTAFFPITVNPISICPTIINSIPETNETIEIYPNPATRELTISSRYEINSVVIANMLGQMVYSNTFSTSSASFQSRPSSRGVDVSELAAGIYFVKVNNTKTAKFVKE